MPYKCPEKRKDYQFNRNLRRRYNMTREQYDKMHKNQKGKCELCGYEPMPPYRGLHVDHCAKTGKIRGLLCAYCNRKIIGAIEKIGFKNIANYLAPKTEENKR